MKARGAFECFVYRNTDRKFFEPLNMNVHLVKDNPFCNFGVQEVFDCVRRVGMTSFSFY